MFERVYRNALILGASFMATGSLSYSMVVDRPPAQCPLQNQYGYNTNNGFGSNFGLNSPKFPNDIMLCDNNCENQFKSALSEFREIVGSSSVSGQVSLKNFPSVVAAQNKLIESMSGVISVLLQQLGKSNEVRNAFIELGSVMKSDLPSFLPEGPQLSSEEQQLLQRHENWARAFSKNPNFRVSSAEFTRWKQAYIKQQTVLQNK